MSKKPLLEELVGITTLSPLSEASPTKKQKDAMRVVQKLADKGKKAEDRAARIWVKALAERTVWGETAAQLKFDWIEEQSTDQNIKNALQETVDNLNQIDNLADLLDEEDLFQQMEGFARRIKF